MVSKLAFKGDKVSKKKKPVKKSRLSSQSLQQLEEDSLEQQQQLNQQPFWQTTSNLSQLKGPITLQLSTTNNNNTPSLLYLTDVNTLAVSQDITTYEHSTKQIIEPNDVKQVFIAVSLPFTSSTASKDKNILPLAFKTWDDGYLTVKNGGAIVTVSYGAISKAQSFELIRKPVEEGKEDIITLHWNGLTLNKDIKFSKQNDDDSIVNIIPRVQTKFLNVKIKEGSSKTSNYADLDSALTDLRNSGIEVNEGVMSRLTKALKEGRLNEGLILEKERIKSDSRC